MNTSLIRNGFDNNEVFLKENVLNFKNLQRPDFLRFPAFLNSQELATDRFLFLRFLLPKILGSDCLQGSFVHKKTPTPQDPPRIIGIGLR